MKETRPENKVLAEAARITAGLQKQKREKEEKRKVEENENIEVKAREILDEVLDGIEKKIKRAALRGEFQILVMGLASKSTRAEWQKEVPGIDFSGFYDSDKPVDCKAFNLVFETCQEKGLNPELRKDSSFYGESMPTIYGIYIKWAAPE